MLWINDGMLVSESMYVLIVGAILLAAYRLWESRSARDAMLLGGAIGLGCLTRPEAIMLVPFIGLPVLFARSAPFRQRLRIALLIGVACLVVILPWWVRNLTTFEKPVFLATGHGSVLQSANCDPAYYGQFLGYWDIHCITDGRPPANAQQEKLLHSKSFPGVVYLLAQDPRDESIPDDKARTKALDYIGDHLTARRSSRSHASVASGVSIASDKRCSSTTSSSAGACGRRGPASGCTTCSPRCPSTRWS